MCVSNVFSEYFIFVFMEAYIFEHWILVFLKSEDFSSEKDTRFLEKAFLEKTLSLNAREGLLNEGPFYYKKFEKK